MEQKIEKNSSPSNDQSIGKNKKEIIPTGIGIAVAFIVIGSILFLFCKFKKVSVDKAETSQSVKVQIKNQDPKEVNVMMDGEIKEIDNLVESLNEEDLSEDLSDEELGI